MRFRHYLRPYIRHSTFIVCVLVLFNLNAWAVKAQATEPAPPMLTLVWQTKFAGDAVLASRGDIAIDEWGNSYVSTQGGNSIKKFDSDGNFVTQWGEDGAEPGNFALSLGVAIDGDNNVYVTDFDNKRIQKFDSNGKFLLQWANEPSTSPAFLAVDANGNVYADEFPPHDSHYIEKFDSTGKLVSEWGNDGERFGGRIEDITSDKEGNIYVADPIKHRIEKLDTNGKLLATFGGSLSRDGKGLFDDPLGIAVDTGGNLFILDSHFLQKLDSAGNFIAQWSTTGGDLDQAARISLDAQNNLYVFAKSDVTAVSGGTVNVFVMKKLRQS